MVRNELQLANYFGFSRISHFQMRLEPIIAAKYCLSVSIYQSVAVMLVVLVEMEMEMSQVEMPQVYRLVY